MRKSVLFLGILLSLACAPPVASADALPPPSRPEWEHTPLPMPDGPEDIGMILLVLAAAVVVSMALIRRRPAHG